MSDIRDDPIGAVNGLLGWVTVGAGAIIGPCSVVIDDVPAGAVVAGNPARQVSAPSATQ